LLQEILLNMREMDAMIKSEGNRVKGAVRAKITETYSFDGYSIERQEEDTSKPVHNQNNNQTEIIQPTELGQVVEFMNQDIIDPSTRMSSIDMMSRLHSLEISQITVVDFLVAMRFLPVSVLPMTRQLKRLKVSQDGKSRGEIVEIVAGKKKHEENMGNVGMMDKARSAVGLR
jgi:hypothetical protein